MHDFCNHDVNDHIDNNDDNYDVNHHIYNNDYIHHDDDNDDK